MSWQSLGSMWSTLGEHQHHASTHTTQKKRKLNKTCAEMGNSATHITHSRAVTCTLHNMSWQSLGSMWSILGEHQHHASTHTTQKKRKLNKTCAEMGNSATHVTHSRALTCTLQYISWQSIQSMWSTLGEHQHHASTHTTQKKRKLNKTNTQHSHHTNHLICDSLDVALCCSCCCCCCCNGCLQLGWYSKYRWYGHSLFYCSSSSSTIFSKCYECEKRTQGILKHTFMSRANEWMDDEEDNDN